MLLKLSALITICAGFNNIYVTNSATNYNNEQNILEMRTRLLEQENISVAEDSTHKILLCNLGAAITSDGYIFHSPTYITFKTTYSVIYLKLQHYELHNKMITILTIGEQPNDSNVATSIVQFRIPAKLENFNIFDIYIDDGNDYFTLKLPRYYLES